MAVATTAVGTAAWAFAQYSADLERARLRVAEGSRILQTRVGRIEYASRGQGPAVLLVHGAGGGIDQAVEIASAIARSGYRVVTLSRFGYLGTPLPADASPAAQADAHAALLDALDIGRATIIGISAGAPSSMQFALRHPGRTRGLVLLVPLAWAPRKAAPLSQAARFMYERALRSDFLFWLAMRVAPSVVMKTVLATPPKVVAAADDAERRRVAAVMEHILPVSARQAGLLNDADVAQSLARYELERIRVPTLLISAADDLYGTYESARYSAAHIPDARFVGYASGGHAWVGHHGEVLAELGAFLARANRKAVAG